MKIVFFYGLFMDENLLRQKGLAPKHVKLARVDGYALRIGNRATLIKSVDERCYGTVMQLQNDELQTLYSEPSVAEYIPEEVVATALTGESLSAVTYVLPVEKLQGKNVEYAKSLAVVAKSLALPKDYIEEINAWRK
ncbi:MAG: hypothetical protein Alis3KO_32700 [Aliiglaciecola sp.]